MKVVTALAAVILLGGCSSFHFPAVHKITIQQGNVVTQSMIDKLKPGMTKSQVRFVMGNPIVQDPLNQSRWTYFYSIKIGARPVIQRELQLYFVDSRLSYFEGDFAPKNYLEAEKKKTEEKGQKKPVEKSKS